MTTLKNEYLKGLSPALLIDHVSKNLYTLKGVLKANDFDFRESKDSIIESIELIQSHVSALQEKIKKG
jgi:hypothetical protein